MSNSKDKLLHINNSGISKNLKIPFYHLCTLEIFLLPNNRSADGSINLSVLAKPTNIQNNYL